MNEEIMLWNDRKSIGTGRPEDDFQPFLVTSLLEDTVAPAGAVIVLPGGAYRSRARHEALPVAQKFNELGFHAFVLEYRVAPYSWPEPQQDVMRAVAMVRDRAGEWNIDPDHIAVCGFSAGGHLAACSGTIALDIDRSAGDRADAVSALPDALILCYPLISGCASITHEVSIRKFAGTETPDDKIRALASLEDHIRPETPPAFLWHTATDGSVNVEHSLRFAQNMWALGKRAELHVYPEGCHGLGLAADTIDISTWPELAANFLESTGFPRRKRL